MGTATEVTTFLGIGNLVDGIVPISVSLHSRKDLQRQITQQAILNFKTETLQSQINKTTQIIQMVNTQLQEMEANITIALLTKLDQSFIRNKKKPFVNKNAIKRKKEGYYIWYLFGIFKN